MRETTFKLYRSRPKSRRRAGRGGVETRSRLEPAFCELFVTSLDHLCIITIDPEGRVTSWNPGAEKVFGYAEAAALGESLDFIHTSADRDAQVFRQSREKAAESGQVSFARWSLRRVGDPFWSVGTMAPMRDKAGTIRGFTIVLRDQTEQRLATESLQRNRDQLNLAIEAANLGMWDWDLASGATVCNDRVLEMFGLKRTSRLDLDMLASRLHPEDAGEFRRIHQAVAFRRDDRFEAEYRVRGEAEAYRWVSSRGEVYFSADGQAVRLIAAIMDITPLKEAERAVRASNEDLERRVKERTALLENAVRQLESFSYSVSHDVRAPLRAMLSYAMLVKDALSGRMDERSALHLDRIIEAARRLQRLTHDLLRYSALGERKAPSGPVDMGRLARQIIAEYPSLQAAKSSIAIADRLHPVRANASLLEQAIANILENAVQFRRPGTELEVRLWTEELGGRVIIKIVDNGIGIDPKHGGRVFKPFERLRPGETTSTGIGLAIAKRAIELMGGTISFESSVDRGTAFRIELPGA